MSQMSVDLRRLSDTVKVAFFFNSFRFLYVAILPKDYDV